jgi:hypothetical protein
MKILHETKEFQIGAGELLEFRNTMELIDEQLRVMPGWYFIGYTFDEETLETRFTLARNHRND